MSLLPFKKPVRNIQFTPYTAPMLKLGAKLDYIPFAERPGSPQESYQNNVFRVRRVFDVPWHLRWHFMYAMLGDVGAEGTKISRRLPMGYTIRDFTSIYDRLDADKINIDAVENPWLFATSIDSIEGVGFDGKDSMYLELTVEQLYGDIHNAHHPAPNSTVPVNQEPPQYDLSSEFSRTKACKTPKLKSEDGQKFYQKKENTLQRLRYIREEISKHDIEVVYKDVIHELKQEEKKTIRESKKDAEEKKTEYKHYLREIKKENRTPLKTNFNALKQKVPARVKATNNATVPGAYPEGTLETNIIAAFDNVDPTAICKYKLARITVSFENVAYRIISNLSISTSNEGKDELLHDVNTTFFRMPTAEFLSLPFGAYRYVHQDTSKRYVVQGSNMRLVAQEEILLSWHRVPFIPDSVRTAIGSVNDDWFPISHLSITDNNDAPHLDNRIWAAPGTLLLTNVEIKPYKHFFSRRVYDINYKFKYFHATEQDSTGALVSAYSDVNTVKASDPCKPSERTRDVCQRQAKGHNYFLKYLFVNVPGKQTNDIKTTTTVDGVTTTTTTATATPYSGTTYPPCAISGSKIPTEKCDPSTNVSLFQYELITHDGCPSGRPVYLSSNFDLLFKAPGHLDNNCTNNTHPASTPTPVSGGLPALKRTHTLENFATTVNDKHKPTFVTPSVTKAKTPNNRLRK